MKQYLEDIKGKKNNCTDISSNQLMKSHTRRPGHGQEKETLNEKLNPSE